MDDTFRGRESVRDFEIVCMTLPGLPDVSIAVAAGRAGALGILDLSCSGLEASRSAIAQLERYSRSGPFGLKVRPEDAGSLDLPTPGGATRVAVLVPSPIRDLADAVRRLKERGARVILEATSIDEANLGVEAGVDGLIAKGNEAAGRVGDETTFVLLQRILQLVDLPVYAQGGIGLHTAAACAAAGAAGLVIDAQLALTAESGLPAHVRSAIARMDGSETACIGEGLGQAYRVYDRPGRSAAAKLRSMIDTEKAGATRISEEIRRLVGWGSPEADLWLIGQDGAFADDLARRFRTVGGIIEGFRDAIDSHLDAAGRLRPLDHGAPLAVSHGTIYPIVQGPMTRVSDVSAFASDVARGGGLPFLALALLRAPDVERLLKETASLLGDRPWGVGILGFVPLELRREQLEVIRRHRPGFVLIAGGRPDQAMALEKDGIPTYLHVPSPGLLEQFLENGSRRFVFEGRECGGHVGPRSSFVLWETMIRILLEKLKPGELEKCHVLFAGGVHDSRSGAMVGAMAASLAEKGVRLGVLMGTAYLFTREAVSSGAILPGFQKEAVECRRTVLLETGPGHSTRCSDTRFAEVFRQEKRRLVAEGRSAEEIRSSLEELNLGRLRIASKGIKRTAEGSGEGTHALVGEGEQHDEGMYMIGQVASLRESVCTIEDLHGDVCIRGMERLAAVAGEPPRVEPAREEGSCDIAIIGMGCVLPKAPDLRTYWSNILRKVDAITEIPESRWDWRLYFDPDPAARDKIYSKWGGFIDDVPFDPMRYGMPPNTLPSIEPLQLLTLEVVRSALEDAGYLDRPFRRDRTSVILGAGGGVADLGNRYGMRAGLPMFVTDLTEETLRRLPEWTEDSFAGILLNVAAGRVANRFDLGGSNYTVDAACASSLAAIYLAAKELETGTSDMVIVGGTDTVQNPFGYLCFSKTKALSPTGRCRTFDQKADGIVISEGLAIVVLKRLADAERDGDRIYAVLKSIASSSDGRDKGLTAPRKEGQVRALRRAYGKAGFSPSTVGLIEAHGTGTVAGDQAEVEALKQVFSDEAAGVQRCAIGSVKSMIGHTKCTAGVAGLTKTALALYHKVLPPTLNVSTPNPKAKFDESPFFVNSEMRPWVAPNDFPRRAGVSAFGFGGTNFHAVLEEHTGRLPAHAPATLGDGAEGDLLIWRGRSREDLLERVGEVDRALQGGARPGRSDLAYTLWLKAREGEGGMTAALVVGPGEALEDRVRLARERLAAVSGSDPRAGFYFETAPLGREGKVAFLFPGQGSQVTDMTLDLALRFEEVLETFERFDRTLTDRFDRPLSGYVFPPPSFTPEERSRRQEDLTRTNVAQPALGAADMAMFRLLESLGVRAEMTAGHSYGEYVALCAAGVFDERTLAILSEARGRCIIEAAEQELGTMAAVSEGRVVIEEALGRREDVWIANLNSPGQTVISGTRAGIEAAVKRLKERGIQSRMLPVSCAFHSPLVAPARDRLANVLDTFVFDSPRCPVFSNMTATPYPDDPKAVAAVLTEHLVNPVLFNAEIEAMYEAGARVFVEVGPRNVLTGLTQQTLGERRFVAMACDAPGRPGAIQLLHTMGHLAAHGVPVDLDRLFRGRPVTQLSVQALHRQREEPALPATIWLVNGSRATPLNKRPTPSMETNDVTRHDMAPTSAPPVASKSDRPIAAAEELLRPSATVQRSLIAASVSREESGLTELPDLDGATRVVLQFQGLMERFLETQRSVMLAALQGEAISAPRLASVQGIQSLPGIPPAPLVADTGVPEVAAAAALPAAEPVEAPAPSRAAVAATVETAVPASEKIREELYRIVSERTGYPPEMLDMEVDMEADLGIDSIKRVEILGALQTACVPADREIDQHAMERLTAQKTLRGVVECLVEALGAAGREARPLEAPVKPVEEAPQPAPASPDSASAGERIDLSEYPRYKVVAVDAPAAPPADLEIGPDRTYVITDDERGIAKALADRIRRKGGSAVILRSGGGEGRTGSRFTADLGDEIPVANALDEIRRAHGRIAGIIHLAPLAHSGELERMDLAAWRRRLSVEITGLFHLARAARGDLGRAELRNAILFAATGMGGDLGLGSKRPVSSPAHGGVAGLVKTLAMEWEGVRCRSVDLDPEDPGSILADRLFDEILLGGDEPEVGYRGAQRLVSRVRPAPVACDAGEPPLGPEDVVLITGGARGITAEVALELANRYRPTLVLLGRTPAPAEESAGTRGLTSMQALKRALMEDLRASGGEIGLAAVEAAYNRLIRDREIRSNLERLKAAGASVEYRQVDVRDELAFTSALREIADRYGRLDAVIHGAGIIEDKLVEDKSPDSFRRVLGTKADSAFILARNLRPDTLKLICFFSSIAGPFGSRGQSDYAAANEVVNRLATRLADEWPARVVSISWGPWDRKGMVGDEVKKQFQSRGIQLIPTAAGRLLAEREIRCADGSAPAIVIGGGPWKLAEETPSVPRVSVLPLLNGMCASRGKGEGIEIVRRFDPTQDLYLVDHQLDGKPVVPVAMAMELMAEVVQHGWPDLQVVGLRELRVLKGMVLETGAGSARVVARVRTAPPQDRVGVDVNVEITDAANPSIRYYRATVELADRVPEPPSYMPLNGSLVPFAMGVEDAYRQWLFHGPLLQGIERVHGISGEGMAATCRPSSPRRCLKSTPGGEWLIDPVVFDSALQMALLWTRSYLDMTPLPSRFQRYRRFGSLSGSKVRCDLKILTKPQGNIFYIDIAFVGPDGRLLGILERQECPCSKALNRLAGSHHGA